MAIRNMLTRLQGPKAVPKTLDGDANLPMDTGHPMRVGLWVLGVGFGGFLVWAALAPLDQGVPTSGQVVVTGNRKAVQNLSPGMVEAILVKDGDEVRSGDVLVRLDPTMARSQYETARSQWFVAKAVGSAPAGRIAGSVGDPLPRRVVEGKGRSAGGECDGRADTVVACPAVRSAGRTWGDEEYVGGPPVISCRSGGHPARQGNAVEAAARGTQRPARTGGRWLSAAQSPVRAGTTAGATWGAISEDLGNLGRTQQSIGEIRMRMLARQQEYRREVENGLADAQKEASALDSRLKGLAFDLANTEVRAPSEGIIVGLSVHTVGGVLAAGTPMMEVVPKNEPLRVDVQIPTPMIDKVRLGLPVEITFPAFNQRTTPQIPGEFVHVNADATTDPQGRLPPYYRGEVVVTADGMKKLKMHESRRECPLRY
jgi:protease secretion system membrane fusion protein